jgi:hypothetical protein
MTQPYPITEKITHVADALSLLLEQFKRMPRMVGVVTAFVAQVQELETAWYSLLTEVNIDTGVGASLDIIGSILGVPRYGLADDVYRVRLRVEVLIRASHGTVDDLLRIMTAATALVPLVTSSLVEPSPATALCTIVGTVPLTFPGELLGFLNRARSLGVQLFLQNDFELAFTLATGLTEELDLTHGWGDDANPVTGGKLSGVGA